VPPDEPAADKRLELAYDAIQEKLKMQDATLASTRTWANNLLATSALFISSAGVGLINNDPTKGPHFAPVLPAVLLLVGRGRSGSARVDRRVAGQRSGSHSVSWV
jgi:hypothetical protein